MSCYWEHSLNLYLCKVWVSYSVKSKCLLEPWRSSLTGRWRKWWLEVRSVTSLVQLNLEKAVGVQLVSEVWTNSSASANSRLRSVLTVLSPVRALGIKASCWCWEAGSSCIIDQWWIHRQISICFHVLSELGRIWYVPVEIQQEFWEALENCRLRSDVQFLYSNEAVAKWVNQSVGNSCPCYLSMIWSISTEGTEKSLFPLKHC